MSDNRGAKQLREITREHGTLRPLARKINVLPGMLSRWRSAKRKPGGKYRALLKKELGIPFESWDEEPALQRAA